MHHGLLSFYLSNTVLNKTLKSFLDCETVIYKSLNNELVLNGWINSNCIKLLILRLNCFHVK